MSREIGVKNELEFDKKTKFEFEFEFVKNEIRPIYKFTIIHNI